MNGVHALDAVSNGENYSIVIWILPIPKIISHVPDDVRIVPITVPKKLTILEATARSINQRCLCPATLIKWSEQTLQPIGGSRLNDVINMRPVSLIWC